ncbi:MAG: SurA N-terminal domain-containing protein [Acidiferrobacter sp.]
MLNALREKTQGLMGGALLVALVVPFVLWGVSSYFGGATAVYVAQGRGIRISQPAFQQALARQRAAMANAFGKDLNPALLTTTRFKMAVLSGLINRDLLLANARQAGYAVSAMQLAEEIRHIPAFRVHNAFNESRYQALLAQQGYSVAGFERRVRDLTLLNQAKVGILASAFVPTPTITQALALLAEHRRISYTIVTPQKYLGQEPVTPAAIKQYYTTHTEEFRLPQKVRVVYLMLSPGVIVRHMKASAIAVSTLQRAYRHHLAQFTLPQKRLVAHILIALPRHPTAAMVARARKRLLAIRTQILHGASFGAMARRYSQDPSSAVHGGRLGYLTAADLSKPVAQAVFALPVGGVSAPVLGHSGLHLLKVLAIRPAVQEPFAAVRAQVQQLVERARARQRLYHLSERLRNAAFEHPHSLGPAAHELGLTLHESGWFSRTGGSGVAALPKVVKAVFHAKVLAGRRNTHAIPIGEDALLVAHVVQRQAARTETLAAARPAIIQKLRLSLATARVRTLTSQLVAQVKKGVPFATAVTRAGLVLKTSSPLVAGSGVLPQPLMRAVFSAAVPVSAVPTRVGLANGSQALFIVRQVVFGNAARHPQLAQKIAAALTEEAGVNAYTDYMNTLRARAHVHINRSAL